MNDAALIEATARLLRTARKASKLRVHARLEPPFAKAMAAFWRRQGRIFVRDFRRLRPAFTVAPGAVREVQAQDWEPIWTVAALASRPRLEMIVQRYLTSSFLAGATEGAAHMGIGSSVGYERATAWLAQHAAEQVTGIDATTMAELRTLLVQATNEGWSYNATARAIQGQFAGFAGARAQLVAVTELAYGYEQGSKAVAVDMGSTGLTMYKAWLGLEDEATCDDCEADMDDGWILLEDTFSSGDDEPPQHPGCRCTVEYEAASTEGPPA